MSFLVGAGLNLLGGLFGGGARKKAEKRAFQYRQKEAEQNFGYTQQLQQGQLSSEERRATEVQQGETGRLGLNINSAELLQNRQASSDQLMQSRGINSTELMQSRQNNSDELKQSRQINSTERLQGRDIDNQQLMQQVSESGLTGRLGMQLDSTERVATEAQQGETGRLGMQLGSSERIATEQDRGQTTRLGMAESGLTTRLGIQTASTERIASEAQAGETGRLGMNLENQRTLQKSSFENQSRQKAQDAARARLSFGGRYGEQRGQYGRY